MNHLKKVVVWLLATTLVFAVAAFFNPQTARTFADTFLHVFVVNDATHAVPVTGNVGINGTPAVRLAGGTNVGINGVPTVQVTGTPTVQLAPGATVGVTGGTFNFSNTPSTPIFTRDRDNPALAPFQTTLCDDDPSGIPLCGSIPNSVTVGANQRLVIEYVEVFCGGGGPGNAFAFQSLLFTTAGGTLAGHVLSFTPNGPLHTLTSQLTRIYADPGTTVGLNVQSNVSVPAGGSVDCHATLSGNLVTP